MKKLALVRCGSAIVAAATLSLASAAFAAPQTFSMLGEMRQRGGNLSLPIPGPATPSFRGSDAVGTPSATAMYHFSRGPVGNCIDCIVQNTGVPNPTVSIPAGLFTFPPGPPGSPRGFPIPGVPNLAQLTTPRSGIAPDPARQPGGAVLSGRLTGLDTFSWCPGPIGIDCTSITQGDPNGGAPGTNANAIITYRRGAGNRFGGVMWQLWGAAGANNFAGALVQIVNNTPLRGQFEPLSGNLPFGGGGSAPGTTVQPATGTAPVYTITSSTPGGFILGIAPTPFSQPPNPVARSFWRLPWTTGMITLVAANAADPAARTITLTGSDTRGPDGSGKLTLVAGGMNLRLDTGIYSAMYSSTRMLTYTPEPGAFLAAGVALAGLALAWGVTRRRGATS